MKKAKKLTAFLLLAAFVLAFIVPVTAMAADTGSITVENPKENVEYTAYKIFDVTYSTDNSAYSYTIANNSEWFSVVATISDDGTVTSNVTGLTFTKAAGSDNTYVVKVGDGFGAASFAEKLKESIEGKTGNLLTKNGTKKTAESLPLGYYLVVGTGNALCNLTTTNPTVTIYDKNDVPLEKAIKDDKHDATIGDEVTFTITGKVPDTTGFTEYMYKISDTMSSGLTLDSDSIMVKINGVEIGANQYNTSITSDENDVVNGFDLTINVMSLQTQRGETIEVTYNATVNEKAKEAIQSNSAILEYSNNPTSNTTTKTEPDVEIVYSSKIEIIKYVTGDESQKLAGAEFVLYKENDDGKNYYQYDTTNNKVAWVSSQDEADRKVTDNNGIAYFEGLANGTYYLLETKAPDGYNLLENATEVTINFSDTMVTVNDSDVPTEIAKVANSTGSTLPSTGGIGTTIFYVVGGVLVVGAGVLLITRKRMSVEK